MPHYELFDRIINGDLRPHKFKSRDNLLGEIIQNIKFSENESEDYLNFLDKKGIKFRVGIFDKEKNQIEYSPERNTELNDLIDIDIPPAPDLKAELYLDVLQNYYFENEYGLELFLILLNLTLLKTLVFIKYKN